MLSRKNFAVLTGVAGLGLASALGSAGVASAAPSMTASTLTFSEPLADSAVATGVNDSGQIFTGYQVSWTGKIPLPTGLIAEHSTKLVVWNGATPTDITPAGTAQPTVSTNVAPVLTGIGDDGTVIGQVELSNVLRGLIYHAGTTTLLPAGDSALDVSSNGLVLVAQVDLAADTTALSEWKNGSLTALGTIPGLVGSGRINASGVAALSVTSSTGGPLWIAANGTLAPIPVPAGMTGGQVVAETDGGRILANLAGPVPVNPSLPSIFEAAVYTASVANGAFAGTTTVLRGSGSNGYAAATAINASGAVVGAEGPSVLQVYPAVWTPAGGAATDLSPNPGNATGIADNGTIIGRYGPVGNGINVPAAWRNGAAITVPASATGVTQLFAISHNGTAIVGTSGGHATKWTVAG